MIHPQDAAPVQLGNIILDPGRSLAYNGNGEVHLTPQECRLLAVFMEHPDQILSRDFLMHAAWNWQISNPLEARTLEVHVCWLRRKLEENPRKPRLIHTVRGTGYRFGTGQAA